MQIALCASSVLTSKSSWSWTRPSITTQYDHINDHVQGAQTTPIRPHFSKLGVSSGYLEFHGSCRAISNCTSTMANPLRESFGRGEKPVKKPSAGQSASLLLAPDVLLSMT